MKNKLLKKIVGILGYKLLEKSLYKNVRSISEITPLSISLILKNLFENYDIKKVIQIGANDGKSFDELNLYIKPRGEHQEYLYNNLHIFQEKKIGQLIWCCGLGKTFMSLMICYKLGCKKILICVPSIYLLEQFKNSIEKAFQLDTINIYNGSK